MTGKRLSVPHLLIWSIPLVFLACTLSASIHTPLSQAQLFGVIGVILYVPMLLAFHVFAKRW